MRGATLSLGGWQRSAFGCIVTAHEQETGRTDTLHEKGLPLSALRSICDRLDLREGSWRIVSVSTPETIFRDLQGTRRHEGRDLLQLPEQAMLARIGRRDLLAPSLLPRDLSRGGRAGGLWHGRARASP